MNSTTSASRAVPQAIKRKVFERSGGRCEYVGANGHRCNSQFQLEVDHIIPWSQGGTHDPELIQILCRLCRYRHNVVNTISLGLKKHTDFFTKNSTLFNRYRCCLEQHDISATQYYCNTTIAVGVESIFGLFACKKE